jgi:spermidine/putrescine ABC transporter ATP-binding subunit
MSDRGAPVEVNDAVKMFGTVTAVDRVTLRVEAEEFLALLGPSGSGKTTLLNMIAGFEYPDAGDILVDGRSVTALPPNKRNLGMVFQRYALFPHMSVAENIAFPLKMRGVSAQDSAQRVEQLLATVKLTGYGTRRPGQLSGGQQQRIAFARAVAHRPPVLLMDEPLAALDKKLREQMQIELKHLQRQLGVTVIFVTHDQIEALTMSDRVAVMNEGRLIQVGTPEQLYEEPSSRFVADFIGETNFIEGSLVSLDEGQGEVALGDFRYGGVAEANVRVGTDVALAVRPEHVTLAPAADKGGGSTFGEIAHIVYSGATVLYVIAVAGGPTLTARAPAGGGDRRRWALGEKVAVTWQVSSARIYPLRPS